MMWMQICRFARLTNAFYKKLETLKAVVGLHFAYYNFEWIHRTLRVTPAMLPLSSCQMHFIYFFWGGYGKNSRLSRPATYEIFIKNNNRGNGEPMEPRWFFINIFHPLIPVITLNDHPRTKHDSLENPTL